MTLKDVALSLHRPELVSLKLQEGRLLACSESKMFLNTFVSIMKSAIQGLKTPFEAKISLEGVGYSVELKEGQLILKVGYSHPVNVAVPDGIVATLPNKKNVVIRSSSKEMLGQFAKVLEKVKYPNVYTRQGVHILGKYYRVKKYVKK